MLLQYIVILQAAAKMFTCADMNPIPWLKPWAERACQDWRRETSLIQKKMQNKKEIATIERNSSWTPGWVYKVVSEGCPIWGGGSKEGKKYSAFSCILRSKNKNFGPCFPCVARKRVHEAHFLVHICAHSAHIFGESSGCISPLDWCRNFQFFALQRSKSWKFTKYEKSEGKAGGETKSLEDFFTMKLSKTRFSKFSSKNEKPFLHFCKKKWGECEEIGPSYRIRLCPTASDRARPLSIKE